MPRNVEIEARLRSVDELVPRARALADGGVAVIDQHDTFFQVPHGRLQLRAFADGSAELIHDHRPDTAEPKAYDYVRVPVVDAQALRRALARGCGVIGQVRKRRLLLLVGTDSACRPRSADPEGCASPERAGACPAKLEIYIHFSIVAP